MQVELTKEEIELLMDALNEYPRQQKNLLSVASQVLPIAVKLQQALQEVKPDDNPDA